MKKVIYAILILVIFLTFGYSWREYSRTPCDRVLEYSVGRFDGNFGINEVQFKKYVASAEVPWESVLGSKKGKSKNLFQYNPDAKFTVNLIYDERQRETTEKQKTESGLSATENFFKNLDVKFNVTKAEYDSQAASYEIKKRAFDERVKSYQDEVDYWNSHNGAPKAKYRELEAERIELNREVVILNSEMEKVNKLALNLNNAVKDRNRAAEEYNKAVLEYNKRYGGHMEFNQAEYTGKEINIYQFSDSKSLIAALAHEFGHALTMDHIENSNSIMYYLRESENIPSNLTPSAEDMVELKRVCPNAVN